MQEQTVVRFTVYRNGANVCTSTRVFNGHISEEYAKREIARAHGVSPDDVVVSLNFR